ncbi:MAG TPA: transporter [Chromatiales bacterium]|nr:transporter [Chromatiales bacterium]
MCSKKLLPAAILIAISAVVQAEDRHHEGHAGHEDHSRHFAHHAHEPGEWMLSYRAMTMAMEGNRDGTSDVSDADVLVDFMVAPQNMDMTMHMIGAMVGVTHDISVMVMVPYLNISMDHIIRTTGEQFTTDASGIGDMKVIGKYLMVDTQDKQIFLSAGLSVPTGDTEVMDTTPMGEVRLPYPMRLGSGTYDLILATSAQYALDNGAWGVDGEAMIRTGSNNGYTLGDRYKLGGWYTRGLAPEWSVTGRLSGETWKDIEGADPAIAHMVAMVPSADPSLRGGRQINASLDLNFEPAGSEHEFSIELGTPVYQKLDGPQLATDWVASIGWRATIN